MREQELSEIRNWVKSQVSANRFNHIQGVVKTSEKLAIHYQLPVLKALVAAWFHDCGKELPRTEMKSWLDKNRVKLDSWEAAMPGLWHPYVGAAIAEIKWGITDISILDAIRCHTLGKAGMKPLSQLIFVADFIEPNRKFPGVVGARRMAKNGLRRGVLAKASMTIEFLLRKNQKIHPRLLETWNYFLHQEE